MMIVCFLILLFTSITVGLNTTVPYAINVGTTCCYTCMTLNNQQLQRVTVTTIITAPRDVTAQRSNCVTINLTDMGGTHLRGRHGECVAWPGGMGQTQKCKPIYTSPTYPRVHDSNRLKLTWQRFKQIKADVAKIQIVARKTTYPEMDIPTYPLN